MNATSPRSLPWWLTVILIVLFLVSLSWFSYGNYQAGSSPTDVIISAFLLSVPLGLLYFSIGVLVAAARQRHFLGQINKRLAKFIYWTPRIAGILITVFVAMFALDVFDMEASIWEKIGGFLIHASPAIVMGILLAFAWRRAWIGFAAFLLGAIFFLRFMIGDPLDNIGIILLFSAPMAAIAMLFWANWKWKEALNPPQTPETPA